MVSLQHLGSSGFFNFILVCYLEMNQRTLTKRRTKGHGMGEAHMRGDPSVTPSFVDGIYCFVVVEFNALQPHFSCIWF